MSKKRLIDFLPRIIQYSTSAYLTELNRLVRVRRVLMQRTILPGTMSLGTRKDSQATTTKMVLRRGVDRSG